MLLIFANIFAAIGAFSGIMLLAHKNKLGFIVFFGVEACMAYIGWHTSQFGVVAMSVIYFFSNFYAYMLWNRDDKRSK